MEFSVAVQPGVVANLTLPAVRCASQPGSGPYTAEVAMIRDRIPVFGGAAPASANSA